MIPIQGQPEPVHFQRKVALKGKNLLERERPATPVPSLFWKGRSYWTEAVDDLRISYDHVCAFSAMRICPVNGAGSVEHFKPKGKYPNQAFDWANFRLVSSRMNARKGEQEDVLDPFRLPNDVFELNPSNGQIFVHPGCPLELRTMAQSTIDRLQLDDALCRMERHRHIGCILLGIWSPQEGKAQSPFVFDRLHAQGYI